MTCDARGKLILLSGSPCVGKSAAAYRLLDTLENSAYFDGDWAWCVNPFSLADPRLRSGDRTMSFALSNYLCLGFSYVIFASVVLTDANIRENILRGVTATGYDVAAFTLTCSDATLAARHKKRGDKNEVSYYWLRLAPQPGDHVIETDGLTPAQVARRIKTIIMEG